MRNITKYVQLMMLAKKIPLALRHQKTNEPRVKEYSFAAILTSQNPFCFRKLNTIPFKKLTLCLGHISLAHDAGRIIKSIYVNKRQYNT